MCLEAHPLTARNRATHPDLRQIAIHTKLLTIFVQKLRWVRVYVADMRCSYYPHRAWETYAMATDYVLFIHGVNTRETEPAQYANRLFSLVKTYIDNTRIDNTHVHQEAKRTIIAVPLYWGNVGIPAEQALLQEYQSARQLWTQLWFRSFREGMLLQFSGDTALYMSRAVGGKIADKLRADMEKVLGSLDSFMANPDDRLHLVAHSLGTVILFDILFSERWGDEGQGLPGWQSVQAIRKVMYGVEPRWEKGIVLGSITTFGSPLGIFSLMNASSESTNKTIDGRILNSHDVASHLQQMLAHLVIRESEQEQIRMLPWNNFIHPGDPLASPLDPLMPHLIDGERKYIELQDILTGAPWDWLFMPLRNSPLALLHAFTAHTGYWQNALVANTIAQSILEAATPIVQKQPASV